jgi:uncharacterized protein (DUF2147 family)
MARVKKGTRAAVAFAVVALGSAVYAAAPASSMTGTWLVESGEAHVEIEPCGEGLCGTVVWMDEPYDEHGNEKIDIFNPDETLRDRKVVGLTIMEVFPANGKPTWKGTIYDPNDGKTYKCSVEPKSEDRIKFRGYIGIPLFGRTTHWTRVE